MVISMTGFAAEVHNFPLASSGKKHSFSVEIKTLNNRFFEATCKLAYPFLPLELDIIALLKKHFVRGRVFCSIKQVQEEIDRGPVQTHVAVAQGYLEGAKLLAKELGVEGNLTITDIIKLPEVISFSQLALSPQAHRLVHKAVESVALQVTKQRKKEGALIEKDLGLSFDTCKKALKKISALHAKLIEQHKQSVSALSPEERGKSEEEKRLLDELQAGINKMDIHEEIQRFEGHLLSAMSLLKEKKQSEKGKRFDFTLQELSREVNTLSAKCSSFEISSMAVDIKVELEKIREQIQNVV